MEVIRFEIGLPVSPASNVAKKVLTIRRADTGVGKFSATEVMELDNEIIEVAIGAVRDTRVDLELKAVDGKTGIESVPIYRRFIASATSAPPLVGNLTASVAAPDVQNEQETTDETPASPPAHVQPPASERTPVSAEAAADKPGDEATANKPID